MRLLTVLFLVGSSALASVYAENIRFSEGTHSNYYEDLTPKVPFAKRVKRSVFAAIGIASQCEPGWTGPFCENPICTNSTVKPLEVPYMNRLIDLLYLPSGCTGKYFVPVDGVSGGLNINVNAAGDPWINLTDVSGNVIQGSGGASNGIGYMTYPSSLAPGQYQLTIDNGGIPTTDCIVTIHAWSSLAVDNGFTMSPQSDDRPAGESAYSNTPMYFVTHAFNVTLPGKVSAVTIRNPNSQQPVYRALLTPRYGCAYEYYAGQYSCSIGSRYIAHVDGKDQFGYDWRRTLDFGCLLPPTTTPLPTTTVPFICYNGGTLLNANQPTASCFCPELFTGPQCAQPACMNGGYLAPSGLKCECPDGFWGDNCEHVTCDPNFGQYLTEDKSLVVVIRNVASMNKYADAIVAAVKSEMEDNDGLKDGLYSSFVLVRYGDGDYLTKQYPESGYQAFLNDLGRVAIVDTVGNCSDVTFDSLFSIFIDYVYDKSPILHFTDAVASDISNWRSVTEANSRRTLPIFTFFLPQSSCNFDPLNEGYRVIQQAGMFSGGMTFQLTNPTNYTLTQFVLGVMRATTKNQNLVYANDLDRCIPNVQRSFMIDSSAENVIIVVTGSNVAFTLWDPDNNSRNIVPISNPDTQNYIWEVQTPKTGEYLFGISTADQQNPCSIRIYSRSSYDFFFATALAPWNDAIDSVPVVGTPLALVAQLNGLYNATRDPYRLFAEITITTNRNLDNNSPGKPMYYANGLYRDQCGYHLYFGIADFCEFDSQPFYATVFADDNSGFTIQRTTIGFCSIFNTTTSPPGSCLNGGVMDPQNNGTCICQVGFSGPFCQNIVCQNGGTPAGSYCQCNVGSWGTFCEMYTCPSVNPFPDQSFEGQTMVFVVATRPSMQDSWNLLSTNVAEFVRDVQSHSSTWIKAWVLVTASGTSYDAIVNDPHPQAFVDAVQAIAANLSAYSDPGDDNCKVQLMAALKYGLYLSEKRSSIYLFSDASGPDTTDFIDVFNLSTENQITINIIQTKTQICTSDGAMPYYIQELAYMTNGFFYITPSVNKILLYITTMYKSAISAQIASPDCASVPAYQYIPVDGWTQSMTISVIGNNITGLTVFTPEGRSAKNLDYEVTLIEEPNLVVKQYIIGCDLGSGWQYYRQSALCVSFGLQKFGWYDSAVYCHNLSPPGSLVDVTSEAKDQFVHTQTQTAENWIGLIRAGNSWTWDVPDGNSAQPLDPSYTRWCTDGTWPDPDPTKNCVYMDPTGCWKNDNCSVNRYFSCQKHRYGQGIFPGSANSNILPGGRWSVQVASENGSCYAQVRSQSDIQIFFGFTQDPHDDFPGLFPNVDSRTNYVVALPTYLSPFQPDSAYTSMEGNLNYAIIGENFTLTNPLTMANRWGCGYPYVSQPFACPSPIAGQNFFMQFSGIDQYGYAFNRFADSNCFKSITRCENNGFLNNGVCVCQPGWTGTKCRNPLCQNGGIDEGDGTCKCPAMFTGTFCELPHCEPPYPKAFGDKSKTLAIMLETSYGMGSTIWLMQKNLKAALDSIQKDPTTSGWFTQFILYPFDSTSNKASWYPVVTSANSDDIVNAVKAMNLSSCPGTGTCDTFCPRPYLDVLDDLLSRNSSEFAYPNSVVLIITQSTPEDASQQDRLTQILQEKKAQINFVLPAIASPCGEGWNSNGVRSMYRTVQYSDGNLFVMSPGDVCANFITKYIPTLYKSAGLESAQLETCGTSDILFQVEHEMFEFTIDYYMPMTTPPFTVSLTDPSGDVIPLPPSIISSDSNYLGIVQVNDTGVTRAGTYQLSIRGGAGANYCFLNIRGRSSIEIYPGFVQNLDGYNGAITDSAHYAPLLAQNNTIVVHAQGLVAASGALLYAQFIDTTGYGLIHTTYLKPRSTECAYEWYGNLPIDWQYPTLLVVIYGRDGRGANFHRNFIITGVATIPAPLPPPTWCSLQAVKHDFVFMIDSSLKENATYSSNFKELKAFVANVMISYKISPDFVQGASLTVSDKAYGGFSFLAATSWNLWNQYINGLNYSAQPGQNTSSGFQYIIDNYSVNQGYRTDPDVRHSIVYLTSTNPTDNDPGRIPYTIVRSGEYGIAVIVYKAETTDAIRSIPSSTSKCLYQADTLNDLNHYGTNFVQGFSCYRQSPCGM